MLHSSHLSLSFLVVCCLVSELWPSTSLPRPLLSPPPPTVQHCLGAFVKAGNSDTSPGQRRRNGGGARPFCWLGRTLFISARPFPKQTRGIGQDLQASGSYFKASPPKKRGLSYDTCRPRVLTSRPFPEQARTVRRHLQASSSDFKAFPQLSENCRTGHIRLEFRLERLSQNKRDLSDKACRPRVPASGHLQTALWHWQISRTSCADKTTRAGLSVFCNDEELRPQPSSEHTAFSSFLSRRRLIDCLRGEQPVRGTVVALSPKLGMFGTPPPLPDGVVEECNRLAVKFMVGSRMRTYGVEIHRQEPFGQADEARQRKPVLGEDGQLVECAENAPVLSGALRKVRRGISRCVLEGQ